MSPRGPRKDVVKVQIVKHGSKRLRAGAGRGGEAGFQNREECLQTGVISWQLLCKCRL